MDTLVAYNGAAEDIRLIISADDIRCGIKVHICIYVEIDEHFAAGDFFFVSMAVFIWQCAVISWLLYVIPEQEVGEDDTNGYAGTE